MRWQDKLTKKELVACKFIEQWQMHWVDDNDKQSYKHVTAFKILE